jgi:hypothetical protein
MQTATTQQVSVPKFRRLLGSITGQSMWDLWLDKATMEQVFLRAFWFSRQFPLDPRSLFIHLSFTRRIMGLLQATVSHNKKIYLCRLRVNAQLWRYYVKQWKEKICERKNRRRECLIESIFSKITSQIYIYIYGRTIDKPTQSCLVSLSAIELTHHDFQCEHNFYTIHTTRAESEIIKQHMWLLFHCYSF